MAEEKEKPLTRDDVLRLIEQNGGTARGLDLSRKEFEEGVDLSKLDLHDIILERANLEGANFQKATLAGANLEKANLSFANLRGARCGGVNLRKALLIGADLRAAVLSGADIEEALFLSIEFSRNTQFINVNWGSKYVCLPTIPVGAMHGIAGRTCRELKNWHTEAGMYDIAGQLFCWEMTAKRKAFWYGEEGRQPMRELLRPLKPKELLRAFFPRKPLPWVLLMLYDLLCGYGEKPWKVVASAGVVVFGLALVYFGIGTLTPNTFLNSLYYSAVSFTALGYGSWAPQPTGWVKGLGAFEAFVGVFMMALFLITFTRKMTR